MAKSISILVNGQKHTVSPEATVASALLSLGVDRLRKSISGQPRGPLCGMGICFECRVTINGLPHQRSCQRLCQDGMEIEVHGQ